MAKKRAHVDAMLTATAASDILTQDVEDMTVEVVENGPTKTVEDSAIEIDVEAEEYRTEIRKYVDDRVLEGKLSKQNHQAFLKRLPTFPSDLDELAVVAGAAANMTGDCLDMTEEEWQAMVEPAEKPTKKTKTKEKLEEIADKAWPDEAAEPEQEEIF
jgi:hypothetical protein